MANNQDENTTVPVIGELFNRQLRKAGLTHKELAELSGVSVRKISDCVAGQPAKPSIVKAIAPHLGLTYEELTGAIPEQSAPPPPHKSVSISHNADGTVMVQIIFAKNCKPPLKPHARKYLRAIVTLLGFENGFDDDDFTALAGSLVVTVPLSRRDAAKLLNAFFAGELEQFDVMAIKVEKSASQIVNQTGNSPDTLTTPSAQPTEADLLPHVPKAKQGVRQESPTIAAEDAGELERAEAEDKTDSSSVGSTAKAINVDSHDLLKKEAPASVEPVEPRNTPFNDRELVSLTAPQLYTLVEMLGSDLPTEALAKIRQILASLSGKSHETRATQ